jgi:hypothetical protein
MRPVISNDGWEHGKSDILTLHSYEQNGERFYEIYNNLDKLTKGDCRNWQQQPFAEGYKYEGQPIVMSEFGGAAYAADCDGALDWGYGNAVKSPKEFLERFKGLIDAIDKMHISGYCYTQLSDVEQEVNGLLDANHKPKLPVEDIKNIVEP